MNTPVTASTVALPKAWDGLHKAIFFLILAASLWVLGSRAERIWNLRTLHARLHGEN